MMRTIQVNIEFEIGDIVYLKTDVDQLPRQILSYQIDDTSTLYNIISGTVTSTHYGVELSHDKIIR